MISIASKVLTTAAEPAASRHIKGQISRNNNARAHVRLRPVDFFVRFVVFLVVVAPPSAIELLHPRRNLLPAAAEEARIAPLAHLFLTSISVARTNLDLEFNMSLGLLGALDLCS